MSKGSAPRKQRDDKAYADNWDRIFGKQAKSERALDEMIATSQELGLYDLPKPVEVTQDAALDAAIRRYGTYPGKVWYKQPDGSLAPADGGLPL